MEMILMIVGIIAVIMMWSTVSKGLNWIGSKIGSTGDIIDHVVIAGKKQAARGELISDSSLDDTKQEWLSKKVETQAKHEELVKTLTANKTTSNKVADWEKYLNGM